MRKVLCTTILFSFLCLTNQLHAQCDLALSSLKLTVNQSKSGIINNKCVLNFDLSFYIDDNKGNKQIYINLWRADQYATGAAEFNTNSTKMPTFAQMDGPNGGYGPVAVVGINNDAVGSFVPFYTADDLNISYSNGRLIQGTSLISEKITTAGDPNIGLTHFVAKGLQLSLPSSACTEVLALKGNIWGSQAQVGKVGATPAIQCKDDKFDFSIGGVNVNAISSLNCAAYPRTFNVQIDATAQTTISYKLYVDADGNGQLTYSSDGITIMDPLAYSSATGIIVKQGQSHTASNIPIASPYGTADIYKDNGCFLVVTYSNISAVDVVQYLANNCRTLPVTFKNFFAVRNQQRNEQVILNWETVQEFNNHGFYVQRKVSGKWKNIAFVFSQADKGVSNLVLAYEFKEINATNEEAQYQIQQVDIDGKVSYSDVKIVNGMKQNSSVFIYPNPSFSGNINLLFKDIGDKKVTVNDVNGRVVKQFHQIKDYNLTIDGLISGFYIINIADNLTKKTIVEKVIIKQ